MRLPEYFMMVVVALALALGVTAGPAWAQEQKQEATPVIVTTVNKQQWTDEVEALGTLRADESVELTASVAEPVTAIHFEDGQRVQKGDLVLEMDVAEELAELSEQRSFLEEAQRQVDRLEPLVKKGAASESLLDESKREVLEAQARINAIQSRVDKRTIKAPYDGVLGLRNISVGALVQPGTLITTIDDLSRMKLDFSVPEVFLSTLKPGVEIVATSEAFPKEEFKGRIASVDSRIDPVTRSIVARAIIDNKEERLRPGLLMQVVLQKNPRETLVVPEEALITEGAKHFVLVIQKGGDAVTAERRAIEIGARQFGEAEVLDGLEAGDRVITHGTLRVRPGAPLSITAEEEGDEPLRQLMQQGANTP